MRTLFQKLLQQLNEKHDLVLVTVISRSGSAPRGAGAQMLVGESGRLWGTIGGGIAEAMCEEQAEALLHGSDSLTRQFVLRPDGTGDTGAVCGGDIEVLFNAIPADAMCWRTAAGGVLARIEEKRTAYLALPVDTGIPEVTDIDRSDGRCFLRIPIGERAILFGGGHCALALAPLLTNVGFRVTVMDQRPEYANTDRFPCAESVICGDYGRIADSLTVMPDDYIVIMTNGHLFDTCVMEQILRLPTAYVGVIGSKSKKEAVNACLRKAGVPEEAIGRVRTPIGVPIKAVTPEEIAVSIAGEMILVRAGRREAMGDVKHACPMRE